MKKFVSILFVAMLSVIIGPNIASAQSESETAATAESGRLIDIPALTPAGANKACAGTKMLNLQLKFTTGRALTPGTFTVRFADGGTKTVDGGFATSDQKFVDTFVSYRGGRKVKPHIIGMSSLRVTNNARMEQAVLVRCMPAA